MADESYIFSPRETGSTLSSSGNGKGVAVATATSRLILLEHLNEFLTKCQIQPIRRPWLDWDKVSKKKQTAILNEKQHRLFLRLTSLIFGTKFSHLLLLIRT